VIFVAIAEFLETPGALLRGGTIIDATLIAASPSTKNRAQKRVCTNPTSGSSIARFSINRQPDGVCDREQVTMLGTLGDKRSSNSISIEITFCRVVSILHP
jgi:hypothetical protein